MPNSLRVLLVECDPIACEAIQAAFRGFGLRALVVLLAETTEAKRMLSKEDEFATVARPNLLLIGPHVPNELACDLIRHIKESPDLRIMPVIRMLDELHEPPHRLRAYDLMANTCIVCPGDAPALLDVIRATCQYWFETSSVP